MRGNIKYKVTAIFFLICFFGVLMFTAHQETDGQEITETVKNREEDYMDTFSYLSEDERIKDNLEQIIEERDKAFLEELEKEALLAQIKRENEYAQTSVTEDLKEFKKEEGQKLLDEEDEANGDEAKQTFSEKLEARKQEEQSRADQKKVVSIQDVFYSNTDKTAADYEHSMTFKITAYCPCAQCNGPWSGGATSTGAKATQGRTIAVDPRVIPYGTKVLIGGHEFVAEDCGGAIKEAHIDLYLDSHDRCNSWGVRYLTVSWNGGSSKLIATLQKQQ
ncbi:MAG: 3D domain-containing protein [Lachnospiraceae bacterium]|nr:3D domain-containing protein [Lachnospiraceae bacterium]